MKAFSEVEGPCRGGGEGPWAVGAVALGGAREAEADGLLDPGGHEGGERWCPVAPPLRWQRSTIAGGGVLDFRRMIV